MSVGTAVALILMACSIPTWAQVPKEGIDIQFEISTTDVPFLNHLPYISQLFCSPGAPPCAPGALREVCCEAVAVQGAANCSGCTSPSQVNCGQLVLSTPPGHAEMWICANCPESCSVATGPTDCGRLQERLIEALCTKAALEATLKAREAFDDERQELLSSVMETAAENAELRAKIQIAEHRQQMQEHLFQSYAENAKLKAELEIVQHKQQLLEQYASGMLENQRLRMELAAHHDRGQPVADANAVPAKDRKKVRTARQDPATAPALQTK